MKSHRSLIGLHLRILPLFTLCLLLLLVQLITSLVHIRVVNNRDYDSSGCSGNDHSNNTNITNNNSGNCIYTCSSDSGRWEGVRRNDEIGQELRLPDLRFALQHVWLDRRLGV